MSPQNIITCMAQRGRCRCGEILKFRKGPEGYKCCCPRCGAWVRLRAGQKKQREQRRRIECTCGTVVLAGKHVPQICPTCRRPLSGNEKTQADEPAAENAELSANLLPPEEKDAIIATPPPPRGWLHSRRFWVLVVLLLLFSAAAATAIVLVALANF